MNPFRLFSLFACLIFLGTSSAHAHRLRFVAFDLPVATGNCRLVPADAEKAVSVEIGINRFSNPIELPPGAYRFLQPDGKVSGELVLQGDPSSHLLIIVLPSDQGKVALVQVPDQEATFSAGDRVFVNATKVPIRVQIGDKTSQCPPGKPQHLKATKGENGKIPVRMWFQKDGQWLKFNSTYWPENNKVRSLVLLFPNPETAAPGVKTIEEVPASLLPPS